MSSIALAHLVAQVAMERDADRAIGQIASAAAQLIGSRHVFVAVLNDEKGYLEVTHGAGEEFLSKAKKQQLMIDVADRAGIMAYVAATGKAFRTGNVLSDPHYKQLLVTTKSEMAVPILDRHSRLVAVINFESDRLNAYSEGDEEMAGAIASLVAVVLDLDEQAGYEEALIQVGSALDTALTEDALIDHVIQIASEVLRFQACSIFLHDKESDTFVLRGTLGRLKPEIGTIRYKRGEGCTGWVCDTGEPILIENPHSDPRWRGKYVEFPNEQIASFVCVPILLRTKVIGAIRVIRRKSDNPYLDMRFTESDLRVLQAIAEQFAVGLANVRNMERVIRSERMIAWGELSAKSSHMIGNRIFAIKGDTNELGHILAEPSPKLDDLNKLQQSLATNVLRIEEILQDFRDFVSATQLHLEFGDVNRVLHETAEEIFPRRSPVKLEMRLADELPGIEIDAKKMRRAFGELIENSMNYMEEGTLTICTSLIERRAHPFVQIEIEDTGPGIDPESKNTIFQPFHSGRVKGMGLGLSIVRGIIDAHGGEVYEAGEPGKGAKFVILLPAPDRP